MFNLKSDLKIYTCDKFNFVQNIMRSAAVVNGKYTFQVAAKVGKLDLGNHRSCYEGIQVTPKGLSWEHFSEVLRIAGHSAESFREFRNYHAWASANPDKTWNDFLQGTDALIALDKPKVDKAFKTVRPDEMMRQLCLGADSTLAMLIGKREYGRRRGSVDRRQDCLVRLWALFGTEVAVSASKGDLEAITNGIQLHDFGITHVEHMQEFLNFVSTKIGALEASELAKNVKELDSLIRRFGGKVPERSRPRSPLLRETFDLIQSDVKQVA